MVSVRNQGRTSNLFSHSDTKDRNPFIAQEADDGGDGDRPKMTHLLGMNQALDGLVSRNHRAGEDDENHEHARQILNAAVAEREALRRLQPRKQERYSKRNRSSGITEIVDGIGQQTNASRNEDDDDLENSRYKQRYE